MALRLEYERITLTTELWSGTSDGTGYCDSRIIYARAAYVKPEPLTANVPRVVYAFSMKGYS